MKSISLYLSAFVPMYAILILQILIEILAGNLHFNVFNTIVLIFLTILIIIGVLGLIFALKLDRSPKTKVKIIKTTNITDQHFFAYISIFILFTLSFDISKFAMFFTTLIILAIIGVVYIHNKIFYINPLLNILGYSFYEITYTTADDTEPKTAMAFYRGHHNLNNLWVNVKLENTNFSFIELPKKLNKKTASE